MKGFTNIPIRFFIVGIDSETEAEGLFEVDEQAFLEHPGEIDYYHATMRQDGISQIELTKGLNA